MQKACWGPLHWEDSLLSFLLFIAFEYVCVSALLLCDMIILLLECVVLVEAYFAFRSVGLYWTKWINKGRLLTQIFKNFKTLQALPVCLLSAEKYLKALCLGPVGLQAWWLCRPRGSVGPMHCMVCRGGSYIPDGSSCNSGSSIGYVCVCVCMGT